MAFYFVERERLYLSFCIAISRSVYFIGFIALIFLSLLLETLYILIYRTNLPNNKEKKMRDVQRQIAIKNTFCFSN